MNNKYLSLYCLSDVHVGCLTIEMCVLIFSEVEVIYDDGDVMLTCYTATD